MTAICSGIMEKRFLSTPSARRATLSSIVKLPPHIISIHALREEGDAIMETMQQHYEISIHALREEGDVLQLRRSGSQQISIHALREEGDPACILLFCS